MKNIVYIILLIMSAVWTGCNYSSARLKAVLKYSGANRAELEKVLEYYSTNPADSLKLKSAIFLIENMPGHYTWSGPFLDDYYARLDTVRNTPYHEKKLFQLLPFDRTEYRNDLEIREDVKYIKADFLIHNIELAFRQWETFPWLAGVDFETFREYLLPYRVDKEPLDYWRDSITFFQKKLQEPVANYEDCQFSINAISNKFHEYSFIPDRQQKIPEEKLKDFKMECIPSSKLDLFIHRIIGIPSAIDYIPHFANRNGRHYWVATMDSKFNSFKVFQANLYRAAKIYRRTFSHNPVIQPGRNEYVPIFFRDPFNKDVTSLYIPTTDISIRVPRHVSAGHAYLAIFNDLTWKPIACAEISGKKAYFRHMGKDIAYLPVYYDEDENMHPLAPPFTVLSNGEIRHLHLSKDSVQKMALIRKYPNSMGHDFWINSLRGTQFEASGQVDFQDIDTVFTIIKKPDFQYQYITPDTIIKKRYWRFVSNYRRGCYLSDLRFYDKQQQEIQGQILNVDSVCAHALSDDSPLTCGFIKNWVGMDFGQPVSISGIRYLPKNDANGIYPDNEYELFYYHFPEGWKSLGIKTTKGYKVEYDKVPAGSLYWLRNRTTGQEERIFTWENGKARFW